MLLIVGFEVYLNLEITNLIVLFRGLFEAKLCPSLEIKWVFGQLVQRAQDCHSFSVLYI